MPKTASKKGDNRAAPYSTSRAESKPPEPPQTSLLAAGLPEDYAVNLAFCRGGLDCYVYEGQVTYKKTKIGRLMAYLCRRPSYSFYEACDFSQESYDVAKKYFTPLGEARWKGADIPSEGGYLHEETVTIDEMHRGKNLGILVVNTLLQRLRDKWVVATCAPGPEGYLGYFMSVREREVAQKKLRSYFGRLGFKPFPGKKPGYCFLTRNAWDSATLGEGDLQATLDLSAPWEEGDAWETTSFGCDPDFQRED